MRLQWRDLVATILVGGAVVVYLLWLMEVLPSAVSDVRAVGAVILLLGFAASATAVVPTFGELLRGSRLYLAATSLLGLLALIAGVVMLVSSSSAAMAVVILTMIVMWLIATIHHSLLAKTTSPGSVEQVSETRQRAAV